ncbi:hypothetical protein VYU27_008740 [Nannochloropsis oceanica]
MSDNEEARFSHLLQPIRDLARNWDIDIASSLEDYLDELDGLKISLDGGQTNLNFAEAALLIQGTACIYSRKVEYLHSLVFQAKGLLSPNEAGAACAHVKVSTVDAFQGAEREVIIYSSVRTAGLGFLDSPNRLNVAITRARRHLILVGNAQALAMLSAAGGGGGGGGGGRGGGHRGMWGEIVRRAVHCSHVQELAGWLTEE